MIDPEIVASRLVRMGITGVDPTKVAAAMELAQDVGEDVSVDEESVESYYPEVEEDFYVPRAPKNWYYNAEGLRRAGRVRDMRSLTQVDPKVFRRLLGI